ncbi:MAG TPA: transcriptional regulator [Clostridiales bacterium]|nr:transcriptional regulator [Clostridiales bacterium]
MNWNGLEYDLKAAPPLDAGFAPFLKILESHQKSARESGRKLAISIRRPGDHVSVYEMMVHGGGQMARADELITERVVKFLLWMKGGYEVTVYGGETIGRHIESLYKSGGKRAFDADFMARVYEKPFAVYVKKYEEKIAESDEAYSLGGNADGCRIGFDAGGSDRKVSAVIDGEAVFSEEVVWHPKTTADPDYHYQGIVSALKKAQTYLPRVDAIGVSSAGIYVDNRCMVASLFLKVPQDLFDAKVKDIYLRAAKEIGAPVKVANDGDVAALAGAMGLGENSILGVAMGTSEAAGFVDGSGQIRGWLNELAFAPVDLSQDAMRDEWSGDIGCGVKYFSQDGVIKLAANAGIAFEETATPAEKLKAVQELLQKDEDAARPIYESIGIYLGHAAALYHHFYHMKNILVMGRVLSGKGGEIIVETATKTLADEYPSYGKAVRIMLPDEKTRRVGQSVAAASL